ncbi:MAG: fibronectin type III domain-containing protein [Acidimicrobiaceae bacterium]|nr:fibronectin type III domain-containing protein [Acidimicrobiaceae bacterium]
MAGVSPSAVVVEELLHSEIIISRRRLVWFGVLRFARLAAAFAVAAGGLGLATATATAQDGGGPCPSDGAAAYTDVPENSFAYNDSRCLRELGVSDQGDAYRPGDDMTRSEMAAFMANAYLALTGEEAPIEEHPFTDIEGDPNADDIARISPNGLAITTGTKPTEYSPGDPVIRGHMALFLTRLYKAVAGEDAPGGTTPFTDIGERSAEQQAAIGQLKALGVTTGTTATTYSPARNVTRAEMASFVARMYRVLDKKAMADTPAAPDAPTGVTTAVSGDNGDALDVTWTAVDGADTYTVQWGADYNNQQTTTGNSVTIHGLTKGTSYTVRVAAVSDAGQSDWAMASGTPGTAPGAVGNLKAAPGASPGTVNVMWSAPTDDGGTPLTGYTVQWAQGNNPEKQSTQINNPSATSHTLSELNSAALYYVWVIAVNGAGDGAATDPVTATPTGSVPSGIVKISLPNGADAGGRFVSLSWPTVTPNTRLGQKLVNYTIQRQCGSQLWPDEIIPNDNTRIVSHDAVSTTANQLLNANAAFLGGAPSVTEEGTLVNGVECTYRVRANTFVDKAGGTDDTQDANEPSLGKWVEGKATPMATTATPAPTGVPSAAPANVSAVAGNRVVQVNWDLTAATPADAITGYRVSLSSPATVPVASVTVSATTESHTFTGLTNGWAYSATVEALNAKGAGDGGSATATPGAATAAPTNVRVTQGATRGTTLKVAWNAPASNSLAAVSGYTLQRRTSATAKAPAGSWTGVTPTQPTGTATMVEDSVSITAGTSYDYRVQATTATTDATAGPWSAAASGTATAVPGTVDATTIEVVPNDGSLTLAWQPAASNGSNVTSYSLRYRKGTATTVAEGYNPWVSAGSAAASLLPTKTITGLTNGTDYQIHITTHNAQGASALPAVTTGQPAAGNGSLPAPTSVKATAVPGTINTDSSIMVSWNAVSRATTYTVEYLVVLNEATPPVPGSPAAGWTAATAPAAGATSTTITGLTTDATYVVRVRAATPVGRYGFSAAVKAESAPTTAPTGVDVVQIVGTTTLRVIWTSLNATNARDQKVTGYKVSWNPTNAQVPGNRGTATVTAPANAGANGMPMSYDITGLTAIGQTIAVSVQAVNAVGPGAIGSDRYPPPS